MHASLIGNMESNKLGLQLGEKDDATLLMPVLAGGELDGQRKA